jgi:tetratricopeptide (TPR) repeat protein
VGPVPAPAYVALVNRVNDFSEPIYDLERRRLQIELIKALKDSTETEGAAKIYSGLGMLAYRDEDFDGALDYYNKAIKLNTSARGELRYHSAVMLMELGKFEEAAPEIEAADPDGEPPRRAVVYLTNRALIHNWRGEHTLAREVVEHAIATLDLQNLEVTYHLASACAELGYNAEAVEFFARFVAIKRGEKVEPSALDYLDRHTEDTKHLLHERSHVRYALAHLRRFGTPPAGAADAVVDHSPDAERSAEEAFAELAALRRAANATAEG